MAHSATSESELPRLRSVLLSLLGEPRSITAPHDLSGITADDWRTIDAMASLHRLRPLLHHRNQGNPGVPGDIRQVWHDAFRHSAMTALVLSGELSATVRLLETAGYAPLALKGAWLAWHAYPHPALRPMRDIDLLLDADTVIPAFRLLCANGYTQCEASQLSDEDSLRLDKHMPPLLSPRGVVIELHQRLWEIDGRMDHAAPSANLAAIRARHIRGTAAGAISYLAPQDTLAHLIIHAVYDHRLDCGPLVLSDIACLLAAHPVAWPDFWAEAERGGWLRGAHLVLSLVARHYPALTIPFHSHLAPYPDGFAAIAEGLLLQELDTRQSAGVAATFATGGLARLLPRLLARRQTRDRHATQRDLSGEGGFAAWAGSRLIRTVRELARPQVRHQSRDLARLSRWLDG